MAKKELKCRGFLIRENGEIVPMESVSEEEMKEVRKAWSKRLSMNLSDYYSNHLDEYERI